jgi:hypothetical protein
MIDVNYIMYGVMLYDNQLDHDYLILHNSTIGSFNSNRIDNELPYYTRQALGDIHTLNTEKTIHPIHKNRKQTIKLMSNACKSDSIKFIRNDDFLTIKKSSTSHMDRYNGYDIYWNEIWYKHT